MRQHQSSDWGTPGRRLLLEDPAPAYDVAGFRAFHDAGFAVARCSGPEDGESCPLVEDGQCPLAEAADVIAYALGAHEDSGRQILRAHRRCHRDTPVVVFDRDGSSVSIPPDATGITRLPWPTSVRGQAQMLSAALAAGGRDGNAVRMTVRGPVTSGERAYALRAAALCSGNPSRQVTGIDLVRETDPSWDRPALARAELDIDGRPAWVHADSTSMTAAIGQLSERIAARLMSP